MMNADEMKRTMSVPEMRKLLGVKKTESYWLVHKNYFKTELINGTMRVDIASFEKWYANQTKHKKITGEKPGAQLCAASYSFRDVANMLGEYDGTIYDLWNRKGLPTVIVFQEKFLTAGMRAKTNTIRWTARLRLKRSKKNSFFSGKRRQCLK